MGKWLNVTALVILVLGVGWFVTKPPAQPQPALQTPGELVADQGREHKELKELEKFEYNSNPPTSGPHDPDWIRPGVYDNPKDKYKLIHSLEHGYVVIHYKCDDCKETLKEFVKKLNLRRVIVVPNPELENRVVMVAWNRRLVLDNWDEELATAFARAYHNQGPEKTVE